MNCKNAILDESFGQPPATVPPQIALQLRALIAVEVAPLLEKISDLEAEITALKAEKAASAPHGDDRPPKTQPPKEPPRSPNTTISEDIIQLKEDVKNLFGDVDLRARDISSDRMWITELEQTRAPTPTQKDRGSILRSLLNKVGKIRQKEAIKIMGISKYAFSRMLKTLTGVVDKAKNRHDRRENILSLAS